MDYKIATKAAYDKYAPEFDIKFGEHFEERVKNKADEFVGHMTGRRLFDIGSGPGIHAAYFASKGLDVVCGDISQHMLSLCEEKGLETRRIDIEQDRLPETFDAIWAYAVLLHIPKKHVPKAFENVIAMLKPGGMLGLALKEGQGEGLETHPKYPDTERWFTYFTDNEIRELVLPKFELVDFDRINVKNRYVFLHYVLRKKL